jgi:large subunit ribosomal protein L32e
MSDEGANPSPGPSPSEPAAPPARGAASRKKKERAPSSPPPAAPASEAEAPAGTKGDGTDDEGEALVPRRPQLSPEETAALAVRKLRSRRRPRFVRQQAHRYWRIGRDGSWRAPRGVQSKQRRHYKYRPPVVSIGYRGPARVRGRTPTGFRPVIVHNAHELESLDGGREIAIIAGGVGTRKRLALEELARQKRIRIANPLLKSGGEE